MRFRAVALSDDEDEAEAAVGPVTVWVGAPGTTPPTTAHNAAQDVLVLLGKHNITDVNVEVRESYYHHKAGPRLLEPVGDLHALVDVIGPLTPALGLGISAAARPGTMCLYLNEGGDSGRLLGVTCRHVLFEPSEPNRDYVHDPNAPCRNVHLLGQKSYNTLVASIKFKIADLGISTRRWEKQIRQFEERENGEDAEHAARARNERLGTQELLDKAMADMDRLIVFQHRVEKDWSDKNDRIFGRVLRSPPIGLSVGEPQFTEDWAIFEVDRDKLGDGFQGNKIDLGACPLSASLLTQISFISCYLYPGTKISPAAFTTMCSPNPEADGEYTYPTDRLLPVRGLIPNHLMRSPDTKDKAGAPRLLVVKHGHSTSTTLGRANGVFSVVRRYDRAGGVAGGGTSLEWGVIDYNGGSGSGAFSEGGDSGSAIVDIYGRVGGMLIGGGGSADASDVTYATPFWWELERIRANGFPDANIDVV